MKTPGKISSLSGILFFLLGNIFSPATVFSQVQFYSSVFFDKFEENKHFEIRFVVEGAKPEEFFAPDFQNFEIVSGPSKALDSTLFYGVLKIKSSYSYKLKPKKPGTFKISPARAKVRNKILESNSLTITVVKASKREFKNFKKDDKLFVEAELSENIFYTGQQLILTYKLYHPANNKIGFNTELEPAMKGFQTQLIDYKFPVQTERINGRNFSVITLQTYVLFPLKAGKLEISPAGFLVEVESRDNMNPFAIQGDRYHLKTEAIHLEIKDFPKGAPEAFTGQVGNYSISIKIASPVQYVDEAFSLTIDVESEANVNTLVAPQIKKHLTDFEVYEPKQIYQDIGIKSGKIISRKSFEYMLIPKKRGKQTIKIHYAYFDPSSKKYIEKFTTPIDIEIKAQSKPINNKGSEKSEIFTSGSSMNLKKSGKPFFGSLAYFAILGLIFSSIPFLYYFRFIHPKLTGKDKMTLLETETKKQIKSLGLLLEKRDSKKFYKQISDLLTKYVSVATDISPIEISEETLINKLSEAGIPNDKTREYSELIKKCEEALYSTDNKTDKTYLLSESIKMLTYLQNELKKKS